MNTFQGMMDHKVQPCNIKREVTRSHKDCRKESPPHHTDLHLLFETKQENKGTKRDALQWGQGAFWALCQGRYCVLCNEGPGRETLASGEGPGREMLVSGEGPGPEAREGGTTTTCSLTDACQDCTPACCQKTLRSCFLNWLCKETAHKARPPRLCCLQGLHLCSRTGTVSSEGGQCARTLPAGAPLWPLLLTAQARSHAGPMAPPGTVTRDPHWPGPHGCRGHQVGGAASLERCSFPRAQRESQERGHFLSSHRCMLLPITNVTGTAFKCFNEKKVFNPLNSGQHERPVTDHLPGPGLRSPAPHSL